MTPSPGRHPRSLDPPEHDVKASTLRTYLEHHLTGANAVIDLVARRVDDGDGDPWMAQFLRELRDEAAQLRRLADRLPAPQLPHRILGRVAIRGARIRLAFESLRRGEEFRDLLELEMVRTGVEGKQCLWRSLLALDDDPALADLDLDALLRQAHDQATRLERRRTDAARAALGSDPAPTPG